MITNNNIKPLYIFESYKVYSLYKVSNAYTWNGYENNNCKSLPVYLEKNSDKFKKKYIEFIHDLSQKEILGKNLPQHLNIKNNHNLWWMSLIVEKSHYKSSNIKDCLKLIALEDLLLTSQTSKVILHFSDKSIINSIKNLCKNLKIDIEVKKINLKSNKENKSIKNSIYSKCPSIIQAFLYLFKNIFSNWSLKKTNKVKWFSKDKKIFFFSYLFHLNKQSFNNGEYKTGQWGPITNLLSELSVRSNWIHHFISNSLTSKPTDGVKFLNKLNEDTYKNGAHQFLYSFLNIKILTNVIINYVLILFKFNILIKFRNLFGINNSNINLWYLLKKDFINSILGPKLIENLLWIELFDCVLKEIPHQEKGIYLQENQSWEKALITSWKNHKHGLLFGLNNGFVRFWDTRFFDDHKLINSTSLNKIPMPDKTILTDNISWDRYLEYKYPEDKLIKAETVRYFNIFEKFSHEKKSRSSEKKDKKLKILILGDFFHESTNNMICCLENINNNYKFDWFIKSHPATPIKVNNYKKIVIKNSNENLTDIISNFDIIIAPAATLSVLEGYIANAKIIIFLNSTDLNISPLRNFSDVKFVHDSLSLDKTLNEDIEQTNTLERTNFFWFDKHLKLWKKILE